MDMIFLYDDVIFYNNNAAVCLCLVNTGHNDCRGADPDYVQQGSSIFRVRGPIYIFHIILWAAVIADYKIIMDILNTIIGAWAARQKTLVKCLWRRWSNGRAEPHSPTLTSLHLCHSSFSNPSAALPTSQLILQLFRCFTYIIGTSPTPQLILKPFLRLIYATAHSTTLPPIHLRHRSFYNPSVASPTSQALHVLHMASRPCIGGWKNSVWWTSLLLSLEVATVVKNFTTSSKLIFL